MTNDKLQLAVSQAQNLVLERLLGVSVFKEASRWNLLWDAYQHLEREYKALGKVVSL